MPTQPPIWSDYLTCTICRNEFDANSRRPVSLVCGHTMCKSCLRGLHFKPCPFDTVVIRTNVNYLPENFALLFLFTDKLTVDHAKRTYDYSSLNFTEDHMKLFHHCLNHIEELASSLRPHVVVTGDVSSAVLSRPMQRKLVALITCQLVEEEGRCRALRAARSLGERVVTELILQHQNSQQLCANLWAAVRARGCQFLGPAMQEEVLKLILLALEDGESFSRKVLVMFVVQRLEVRYSQASKTSIGHVVQLLYRASCFKVFKRDGESSLMQLKEEFRSYDALRREHDAQIVQIATESGLRIAPDQWSSLLYADTTHKSHMQSIMDKLQTPQSFAQSVQELVIALQRTSDPGHLQRLQRDFELLADIDITSDMSASWIDTEQALCAIKLVVNGMVSFIKSHGSRDIHDHCQTFNNKYKTNMCRDFTQRNICPRGVNCTFAHSQDEMERHRSRNKKGGGVLWSGNSNSSPFLKEQNLAGMNNTSDAMQQQTTVPQKQTRRNRSGTRQEQDVPSKPGLSSSVSESSNTPVDDNYENANERMSRLSLNGEISNVNAMFSSNSIHNNDGMVNSVNNNNLSRQCEVTHSHPRPPVHHQHHHQLPGTQADFESNLPPVVTNSTTLSWASPSGSQMLTSALPSAEPHLNQPRGGMLFHPSFPNAAQQSRATLIALSPQAPPPQVPSHMQPIPARAVRVFPAPATFHPNIQQAQLLTAGPGQPVALAPAPPGTPVEETISVISPTCYDPNTGYQLWQGGGYRGSFYHVMNVESIQPDMMSNPVNELAFLEKRKMDLLTHLEKDDLSFLKKRQDVIANGGDHPILSANQGCSHNPNSSEKSIYSPWTSASFMPQFKPNPANPEMTHHRHVSVSLSSNHDSLKTTIAEQPSSSSTNTTATTTMEMTASSQGGVNYGSSSSRKKLCQEDIERPKVEEDEEFIPFDPPFVSRFGPICRMARSLITGNTAPIQVNATTLSSGMIAITPAPNVNPLSSTWYLQSTNQQSPSHSQGQLHQLQQHPNPTLIPHQQLTTVEPFYGQQIPAFHNPNTFPVIIQEGVAPPPAGMNCEENMKLELMQLDKQISCLKKQHYHQAYSNNNIKESKPIVERNSRLCAAAAVTSNLCSGHHHHHQNNSPNVNPPDNEKLHTSVGSWEQEMLQDNQRNEKKVVSKCYKE